jgi:hypothetical protein
LPEAPGDKEKELPPRHGEDEGRRGVYPQISLINADESRKGCVEAQEASYLRPSAKSVDISVFSEFSVSLWVSLFQ